MDELSTERFAPTPLARTHCRSCGAEIVWAITDGPGRPMPVDPDPVPGGNLRLTRDRSRFLVQVVRPGDGTHQSHWTSCPHARDWRRR